MAGLWIRHFILTLLIPVLPLQALAETVPSLFPHNHSLAAWASAKPTVVANHHHADQRHDDSTINHPRHADHHHDVASLHHANHQDTVFDECNCAWCMGCAIPATAPLLTYALNASPQELMVSRLLLYILDQPQRPTR